MKRLFAMLLTLSLFAGILPFNASAATLKKGDIVKFGTYEQDNKTKNGPEDIQWIVVRISSDGERAVLVSRYVLDCVRFHNETEAVTWEDSYVRRWLRKVFLKNAFNESEQKRLVEFTNTMDPNPVYGTDGGEDTKDKVALLSIEQAEQYFKNDEARRCKATAYAKARGTQVYSTSAWWRLRSPGKYDTGVASVYASGQIAYEGDTMWDKGCGIRPMIVVKIK